MIQYFGLVKESWFFCLDESQKTVPEVRQELFIHVVGLCHIVGKCLTTLKKIIIALVIYSCSSSLSISVSEDRTETGKALPWAPTP